MQKLIEHLLHPILKHPEEMGLNIIEGKASIFVELKVHDDDVAMLRSENDSHLNAVRHILSIASGKRKPSLELITGDFQSEDTEEDMPQETEKASEDNEPEVVAEGDSE